VFKVAHPAFCFAALKRRKAWTASDVFSFDVVIVASGETFDVLVSNVFGKLPAFCHPVFGSVA